MYVVIKLSEGLLSCLKGYSLKTSDWGRIGSFFLFCLKAALMDVCKDWTSVENRQDMINDQNTKYLQ